MNQVIFLLIKIYRTALSPVFGGQCRFYPSCSHYAEEAVQKKGWRSGTVLFLKRIAKCHPFYSGGFDPVE